MRLTSAILWMGDYHLGSLPGHCDCKLRFSHKGVVNLLQWGTADIDTKPPVVESTTLGGPHHIDINIGGFLCSTCASLERGIRPHHDLILAVWIKY